MPGRSRGKRTGGELQELEVASTKGRRKAPVRRSRGARLDAELKRSRNESLLRRLRFRMLDEAEFPNGKGWWEWLRASKQSAVAIHCNWVKCRDLYIFFLEFWNNI